MGLAVTEHSLRLVRRMQRAGREETELRNDKNPEYVGTIAIANPQEFLHKTWAGQPGSDPNMPAALIW
jgi:hypothetical protein